MLSPRAGYILALALVLLAGAWTFNQPIVGLSLLVTGMTFLSMAFLVRLLFLRHQNAELNFFNTIEAFVENDAAPTFTTDKDGLLTYRNEAANTRFSKADGETLAAVLGDLFASPAAVLYRLQSKAQIGGSAREDVVLRRGHMRLAVHQIGKNGFLWRLEDLSDKGPAGRTGENINLPMMTVSKTGTILFMNEALRRLLGGRQTTLDRVFTEMPIANGMVSQVSAKDGNVNALICEIASSAGRREIYLLPEPESKLVDPEEWDLVEALPVPLLKLDGEGQILMANQRARSLLGDENAIGTLLSNQVEGAGRPISEWLREVMAGRLQGRSEVVRALKPEGEVFLQVSLEQVSEPEGRVLVAVLQDATELKSMEAQYLQAQKMQSLGHLSGGIAHDFNNLLTAISGHCDLLILRHDESDPDYADLSQIRQNANRAAAVVGKLLSFSRKQTLRPEVIDLTDILGELTHLLNRLVGETVHLDLVHDQQILPIRADRHHLEQVLVNLVLNARDAMPDGGEVVLETRNVILSNPLERDRATVPAGEFVLIKVSDQGCGIAADSLTKIFEPFYTTKGVGKGTGLGLSMAYGIVKQSGGYIFVDSIVGSGTTFSLYLPVSNDAVVTDLQKGDGQSELGKVVQLERKEPDAVLPPQSDGAPVASDLNSGIDESDLENTNLDRNDLSKTVGRDNPNATVEVASAEPHEDDTGPKLTASQLDENTQQRDADILASVVQAGAETNPLDENLPNPTHQPAPREGGIVLLVEDEAPVRAFASRALRMRGFTVLEAENAEEALKTLEDENLNVDIFVTDVIMPGMDGPTWVTLALESRPGVKVVFVSGYAEDSVSEHQARIPNSVFLPKPFSLSELTETVQRQLH